MITIYGLCDPRTHEIFYVGLTSRHWSVRLSQHCSDPASAAYRRIREIGERPICIILGSFSDEQDARAFERDLISLIDGPLVNREPRYALYGGRVYPRPDVEGRRVEDVDEIVYEAFDDGWGSLRKMFYPADEDDEAA